MADEEIDSFVKKNLYGLRVTMHHFLLKVKLEKFVSTLVVISEEIYHHPSIM